MDIPDSVRDHAASKTLPNIILFKGEFTGSQTFPDDTSELSNLVTRATTSGNFASLFRLRDAMGLALVMDGLRREFRKRTLSIPSIIDSLLHSPCDPDWAGHTRYITLENHFMSNIDNATNWNASPCHILSVRTPSRRTSDEDYAKFIFIHYDNRGHLGVILTDSGLVDLDSVKAHRILVEVTPTNRNNVYEFRREFIRLVSWPGLYAYILDHKGISVDKNGKLAACPADLSRDIVGIATHLASCSISITRVEAMLHWGLQYCLDVQSLPSMTDLRRNDFAIIYKYARIRSLFYPLRRVNNRETYSLPAHLLREEVLEYRRRQFILNHWKDSNSLPSADYKVPIIHVPANPPATVPISVAALSLSDNGNANSPPTDATATSANGPSTASASATNVEGPPAGLEQSAPATESPIPGAITDSDVDMSGSKQESQENTSPMEDVE
ncbi:hypothetical protein V5O48_016649 [Marasmius crinis-equi]|uniref:Uncharacterized protein n=1 Tax=Marasmius crinis-equi TaxID=585013 RepID=A0ABR3ERF4_9AGAR